MSARLTLLPSPATAVALVLGTIDLDASPMAPCNVLFIVVDDLRSDLGVCGHALAKAPKIDRLAAQGTIFLRAYCQQAVCPTARASVLTGRRSDEFEYWNLFTRFRDRFSDIVTLPEHLKNLGFVTTAFGKICHSQEGYQDQNIRTVGDPYGAIPRKALGTLQCAIRPRRNK